MDRRHKILLNVVVIVLILRRCSLCCAIGNGCRCI